MTLEPNDRIHGCNVIDEVVSAEIPDKDENPALYEAVSRHMMHGPCGALNSRSVCMDQGNCSKKFPKDYCSATHDNLNGYPVYKRPDNGRTVTKRVQQVDIDIGNGFVVPYNPYLLQKFNCHMNVEVCTAVKSIKYIYKYVYKGYDSATVRLTRNEETGNNDQVVNYDEINSFLNCRYVGSTESEIKLTIKYIDR